MDKKNQKAKKKSEWTIKKAEKQQQQQQEKQPRNQSETTMPTYTSRCIVMPWYVFLHFLKFLYDICILEKVPNADVK